MLHKIERKVQMSGQGPGNVARTVLTILLYRMNKTDAVCFSNLKKKWTNGNCKKRKQTRLPNDESQIMHFVIQFWKDKNKISNKQIKTLQSEKQSQRQKANYEWRKAKWCDLLTVHWSSSLSGLFGACILMWCPPAEDLDVTPEWFLLLLG